MRIRQTRLWVCAVAALLAGTTACSSDAGEPADKGMGKGKGKDSRAVAAACRNGTYAWFNTDKRDVLTGVAEKQTLGKGGGELTNRLIPLHTPRVAVTSENGPRVGAEATLRSLGAHIGDTDAGDSDGYAFADVRRAAPDLHAHSTTSSSIDSGGTFVDFAWVNQVTADFRYTCGDGSHVVGRATSWTVDGSGVLECSEPIGKMKKGSLVLEAARLSCDPDDPATQDTRR